MALIPWYKVVHPREDLREEKPLDAAEFAVHLDQVRDGRAPIDYQDPERFFQRTYLTQSLVTLATESIRRLSGERSEASAVFNLTTQFGGGKTHALTLLYHLATHGSEALKWFGVGSLLERSGASAIPQASTAVFVGTEFDALTGRGGYDGTPLRRTPWGEIAYQLRGVEGLELLAEHERQGVAPAGDVIHKLFPPDRPCLILMDELISYVSRNRSSGRADQLYNFLQSLTEAARGHDRIVLVVSIPASTLEMTAEDETDYSRYKKLLDRLSKPIMMSAESETSEIIRRRLFEWGEVAGADGRVVLPRDAVRTCLQYSDWVVEFRQQLPHWFPLDHAQEAFEATYPFHPMVISVFERKWRSLPRFQQTRGILRLLAQWVSKAYNDGYRDVHRDPLVGLGTAPLDNALFRNALNEQLGEQRLEAVITTDICGRSDSHALRLDQDAIDDIKKARVHRKVATTIFFESNGGQTHAEATLPEIRLAVAEPELDIGSVENAVETLADTCYYLVVQKNRYNFSLRPNLNKLLADRRATIPAAQIDEFVLAAIREVFARGTGIERIYFPHKSIDIPDRPALALVVVAPSQSLQEMEVMHFIETMTGEHGTSFRIYKNALIWSVADPATTIIDDARKYLALQAISDDDFDRLDEQQRQQLSDSLGRAHRDLQESVWRSYKFLFLFGKNNTIERIDLGLITSSSAKTLLDLLVQRLKYSDEVVEQFSPNFLLRNWPPAFKEWNTKSVRDMVYASPQFPRLLNPESLRTTIAQGVTDSLLAYVGKRSDGEYEPFKFGTPLRNYDIEFSEDLYIIRRELAEQYLEMKRAETPPQGNAPEPPAIDNPTPPRKNVGRREPIDGADNPKDTPVILSTESVKSIRWVGDIPLQKWMTFYTRILSPFALGQGIKLTLKVEINPVEGISQQKTDQVTSGLRDLALDGDLEIE